METNKNTENNNKVLWDIVTCLIFAIMNVAWKILGFIKAYGKQVVFAVCVCVGAVIVVPVLIYFLIFTGAWFLILMFIFELTH